MRTIAAGKLKSPTFARALAHLAKQQQLSVLSLVGLAACSNNAAPPAATPMPPPPPPPPQSSASIRSGTAPIVDAATFLDADGDGALSGPEMSALSAAGGTVTVEGDSGAWIAQGGFDTVAGLSLDGLSLAAPSGASIISPLTTLLARTSLTQDQLKEGVGLATTLDLTTYDALADAEDGDPIALAVLQTEDDVLFLIKTLQTLAQSLGSAANADEAQTLAEASLATVLGSGFSNFSDPQVVEDLLVAAGLDAAVSAQRLIDIAGLISSYYGAPDRLTDPELSELAAVTVFRLTSFLEDIAVFANADDEAAGILANQMFADLFSLDDLVEDILSGLPEAGAAAFGAADALRVGQGETLTIDLSVDTGLLANDFLGASTDASVVALSLDPDLGPGSRLTLDAATQTAQLELPDMFIGTAILRYDVETSGGDTYQATALVRVEDLDLSPVANPDSFTTGGDTAFVMRVLDNDDNPDQEPLNIIALDGAEIPAGSFTSATVFLSSGARLEANFGQILFLPNGAYNDLAPGESVTETFTYTVADLNGNDSTATVTLTVEGEGTVSAVGGLSASVAEDAGSQSFSGQITVPGTNNPVTIASVNGLALFEGERTVSNEFINLTITQDGSYTYSLRDLTFQPNIDGGERAAELFRITLQNPDLSTFEEELVVFIDGVNDAPTITIDGQRIGNIDINGKAARQFNLEQIPAGDIFFDEGRGQVYVSTNLGRIERWDIETQTFLDPIMVGSRLGTMELSSDGNTLFVAEQSLRDEMTDINFSATASFHEVDLDTLQTQTLDFTVNGQERATSDIAAGNGSQLFITTDFSGSGSNPFRSYNIDTGTISIRDDQPQVQQSSFLEVSTDGRYVLVQEVNISSGPLVLYDTDTNTRIANTQRLFGGDPQTGGSFGLAFHNGVADVSDQGELVAVASSSTVFVYDLDLEPLFSIEAFNLIGGSLTDIQFSSEGDTLFLISAGSGTVSTFDIASQSVIDTLDIPIGSSGNAFFGGDEGIVSSDEELLILETQTGFEIVGLGDDTDLFSTLLLEVESGTTFVSDVTVDDPDPRDAPSLTISGGADAEMFLLDDETTAISFAQAPDIDMPTDADGDGRFELEITATDSAGLSTTQALFIDIVPSTTMASDPVANSEPSSVLPQIQDPINSNPSFSGGATITSGFTETVALMPLDVVLV